LGSSAEETQAKLCASALTPHELLSQHGIVPYLVNGRHVKNVPGRKSDWNDAQWLQKLHALGLLRASFRPDTEITALRTLVRYRAELIAHRAPHILHMQRALQQMNVQLERVLSDIMGTTGQAIIRARFSRTCRECS
jgi:transposase